jgi:hypothetical protein
MEDKEVEYIDVLDEEGVFTGRKEPRAIIHSKGLWHRVTHGFPLFPTVWY